MTEENVKSEETTVSTQEDVTEVKAEKISAAEVPAAEAATAEVPAAEIPAEAAAGLVSEMAAEPAAAPEEETGKAEAETAKEEAPAVEEACADEKTEKKQEEKKEKKKSRLVAFFANAKNGGDLFVKCFLMLLLSTVLAYAGLMIWGLIDKLIPTFYNAPYCAIITAGLFLLVGIILIILMIARYFRNRKRKK